MKAAFFAVTGAGIMLGLLLPGAKPKAAPPPPALAAAVADAPQPTVLEREDNGHFFTVADVDGEPIKFLVDTGATTIALTEDDARRAGVNFDRASFEVVARGAGGDLRGQEVQLKDVVLDGKRVSDIRATVVEGMDISLLGQNFLRRYDMSINGDTMTIK